MYHLMIRQISSFRIGDMCFLETFRLLHKKSFCWTIHMVVIIMCILFVNSHVHYFAFVEVTKEGLTALMMVEDASTMLIVIEPLSTVEIAIVPLELT
jgi:hypothetical protein